MLIHEQSDEIKIGQIDIYGSMGSIGLALTWERQHFVLCMYRIFAMRGPSSLGYKSHAIVLLSTERELRFQALKSVTP